MVPPPVPSVDPANPVNPQIGGTAAGPQETRGPSATSSAAPQPSATAPALMWLENLVLDLIPLQQDKMTRLGKSRSGAMIPFVEPERVLSASDFQKMGMAKTPAQLEAIAATLKVNLIF